MEPRSEALPRRPNGTAVTVGGGSAIVYGAALAPGFAGVVPGGHPDFRPLLTSGDHPVVATVSGASSPASTLITMQN